MDDDMYKRAWQAISEAATKAGWADQWLMDYDKGFQGPWSDYIAYRISQQAIVTTDWE